MNPWDDYDNQREAYERQPVKKTGGYDSRRVAEKVATTQPEPIALDVEITQVSTVLPENEPAPTTDQQVRR